MILDDLTDVFWRHFFLLLLNDTELGAEWGPDWAEAIRAARAAGALGWRTTQADTIEADLEGLMEEGLLAEEKDALQADIAALTAEKGELDTRVEQKRQEKAEQSENDDDGTPFDEKDDEFEGVVDPYVDPFARAVMVNAKGGEVKIEKAERGRY